MQGHTQLTNCCCSGCFIAREDNEGTMDPPRHTIGAVSAGAVTVLSSTIFLPKKDKQKEGGSEVQKDAK